MGEAGAALRAAQEPIGQLSGAGMERFVRIAEGLDVAPALAELTSQPEY